MIPALPLAQILPTDTNWISILLLIAILVIGWIILRFVLRLATRVFSLGCTLIIVLAILLLALNYFSR